MLDRLHNFESFVCAKFIELYIRYILDFYSEKCYNMATLRKQLQPIERRNVMSIFVIVRDQVLSLPSVLGLSSNNTVSNLDSTLKVLR